jgi:hypothetical protein
MLVVQAAYASAQFSFQRFLVVFGLKILQLGADLLVPKVFLFLKKRVGEAQLGFKLFYGFRQNAVVDLADHAACFHEIAFPRTYMATMDTAGFGGNQYIVFGVNRALQFHIMRNVSASSVSIETGFTLASTVVSSGRVCDLDFECLDLFFVFDLLAFSWTNSSFLPSKPSSFSPPQEASKVATAVIIKICLFMVLVSSCFKFR